MSTSNITGSLSAENNSQNISANDLDVIQDMIDISADRLEGLRTQCSTSATLTQKEIRSLETKLVRMFSELLLTKARLNERIPANGLPHTTGSELKQWLRVVGLSSESLNVFTSRLSTLEQLLEQTDEELKQMLSNNPLYREEEVRRLTKAMQNLRKCRKALSENEGTENKDSLGDQLFWDSWDHRNQHHPHHRGSMGNIGLTASPRNQRLAKHGVKHNVVSSASNRASANDISCKSSHSINTSHTPDEVSSLQGSSMTLTLTPSPPSSPFATTNTVNMGTILSGGQTVTGGSLNGTPQRIKLSGTPPPMRKHKTHMSSGQQNLTPTHAAASHNAHMQDGAIPLSKSKSNESQQFNESSIMSAANSPPTGSTNSTISRSRIHTDPSPDSYSLASSDIYVENNNNPNSLQVPRSPCTPIVTVGMGHTISHRFTKVFKMMSTCYLCQKQMFFGLKCKECKYRCHKDCEPNVPPSCGLPPEFVDEFKRTLGHTQATASHQSTAHTSPNMAGGRSALRSTKPTAGAHYVDSSSPGSSCNSSSPSSPALFHMQHGTNYAASGGIMTSSGGGSSSTSSNMLSTPSSYMPTSQFNFPEVTITSNYNQAAGSTTQTLYPSQATENSDFTSSITSSDYTTDTISLASTIKTNAEASSIAGSKYSSTNASSSNTNHQHNSSLINSNHSAFTSSSIISNTETFYPRKLSSAGVDKRAPFSELSDTHKSNDSDKTVSLSGSTSASTDSDRTPVRLDSTEDGDSGNWPRQNSLSLKEWDIPYGDLKLLEQIGKGRFGTVHRALWHGDVAVKLLKEDYLDDERMLEAFKVEVANFKKTRHENLVLFMGACMNPPYLAIVTSLCKGNTLYTYIHSRRDKFTINKTTLVAQQISQGMGYLHARGIYHKDLRTKNIFLENGKVIITDFGLFSSTKLLYCDKGLGVPKEWLCYLAPELMRALMPRKPTDEILPFSEAADVYSFGTVWYELLCGEFPFKVQPPEAIIWQVGRGMKQTLANLQTTRDIKDILMFCWSYPAVDRPDFPKLLTLLERLPKKRLARSPSHPVQLSRSAESVF